MTPTFTASHRGGSGAPMVLIHGFTDTWHTWDLIRPQLEEQYDVLALTLPGHAGGPPIEGPVSEQVFIDLIEGAMDEAGLETAHIVGNSLGGYIALHLAARGRARSVVALAPAGGWAEGDTSFHETLDQFLTMETLLQQAVAYADAIVATPEGRQNATLLVSEHPEHLTPEFVMGLIHGAAACTAVRPLVDYALAEGWRLDAGQIDCPVRIVWGTEDKLLKWPEAAARFKDPWLPQAEWTVLDGVGHCIQFDSPQRTTELILDFAKD